MDKKVNVFEYAEGARSYFCNGITLKTPFDVDRLVDDFYLERNHTILNGYCLAAALSTLKDDDIKNCSAFEEIFYMLLTNDELELFGARSVLEIDRCLCVMGMRRLKEFCSEMDLTYETLCRLLAKRGANFELLYRMEITESGYADIEFLAQIFSHCDIDFPVSWREAGSAIGNMLHEDYSTMRIFATRICEHFRWDLSGINNSGFLKAIGDETRRFSMQNQIYDVYRCYAEAHMV